MTLAAQTRGLRKLVWFAAALPVVASVRLGLNVLGYRRLSRIIPENTLFPPASPELAARCRWAVERAAGLVPGATCLTQALAGRFLLARRRAGSTITIGVAPKETGGFRAHAWLRSGEQVVLGGTQEDLRDFTELAELGVRS